MSTRFCVMLLISKDFPSSLPYYFIIQKLGLGNLKPEHLRWKY